MVFICSDCALDLHSSHSSDLKKIGDMMLDMRREFLNLEEKFQDSFQNSMVGKKINQLNQNVLKIIDTSIGSNLKNIDRLQSKLETLKDYEKLLNSELQSKVLKESALLMNNQSLSDFIKTQSEISLINKNWDSSGSKVKIDLFNEKEKIEKKCSDLLKVAEKDVTINSISPVSLKDDDINVLKKGNLFRDIETLIQIRTDEIKSILGKSSKEENFRLLLEQPSFKTFSENLDKDISNKKEKLAVFDKDYDFLISLKKNEVFIIDKSAPTQLKTVKLENSCFIDKVIPNFPFDQSKFVNLGDSVLITGGLVEKSAMESCFIITVEKRDHYSVTVNNYTDMCEKRERHNIIFLENLKVVVVCSGFYSKSAEFTSLDGKWNKLPDLKKSRGNATMFYVNERFVYCIGGFMVGERSSGEYLSSCEYMDMQNQLDGWNYIDFEAKFNLSSILCARGVIQESSNKIILVGGYDGNKYVQDTHEIECNNETGMATNFRKSNVKFSSHFNSKGLIFTSSNKFIRIGLAYRAFDFTARLITYSPETKTLLV